MVAKAGKRLIKDDPNGVIDLVMDPTNPNTFICFKPGTVSRLRWSDPTPQDGDFIWKTTDGGKNLE
jgi:hypothetical protein